MNNLTNILTGKAKNGEAAFDISIIQLYDDTCLIYNETLYQLKNGELTEYKLFENLRINSRARMEAAIDTLTKYPKDMLTLLKAHCEIINKIFDKKTCELHFHNTIVISILDIDISAFNPFSTSYRRKMTFPRSLTLEFPFNSNKVLIEVFYFRKLERYELNLSDPAYLDELQKILIEICDESKVEAIKYDKFKKRMREIAKERYRRKHARKNGRRERNKS